MEEERYFDDYLKKFIKTYYCLRLEWFKYQGMNVTPEVHKELRQLMKDRITEDLIVPFQSYLDKANSGDMSDDDCKNTYTFLDKINNLISETFNKS